MSGILLPVLPKRTYDFTGLDLSVPESQLILERIDASEFVEAIVILRVHSASAAGGTIKIQLYEDGYCKWDPGLKFLQNIAALQIDSTTVAPKLIASGRVVQGQLISLGIEGNRTSAAQLTATISIDLCLRTSEDS